MSPKPRRRIVFNGMFMGLGQEFQALDFRKVNIRLRCIFISLTFWCKLAVTFESGRLRFTGIEMKNYPKQEHEKEEIEPIFSSGSAKSRNFPIDLGYLKKQTMEDEDLQSEILALFMIQCENCRKSLTGSKTAKEIIEFAHQIKGTARSIGAQELSTTAAKLELQPDNSTYLANLHQQLNQVELFIKTKM